MHRDLRMPHLFVFFSSCCWVLSLPSKPIHATKHGGGGGGFLHVRLIIWACTYMFFLEKMQERASDVLSHGIYILVYFGCVLRFVFAQIVTLG